MTLKPCPFCGAGQTEERETRLPPRMDGKQTALVSVQIIHWCEPVTGIVGGHIEYRGRDHESVRAAWNRRS